jgi:thiol-disulfide isomerase/thioredoxin
MYRVISLCVLIFSGSVFATQEPIELEVSPSLLLNIVSSGQTTFTLPEFEVFNSKGNGVFHQLSYDKTFKNTLVNAILNPVENGEKLQDSLKIISHKNTKTPYQVDSSKYDYIFVEYWASWCAPCFHQMAKVKEVLTEHSNINILWLKVEKDLTKIENVKVAKKLNITSN